MKAIRILCLSLLMSAAGAADDPIAVPVGEIVTDSALFPDETVNFVLDPSGSIPAPILASSGSTN